MTDQERKELLTQLNRLDRKERKKLLEEASRARQMAQQRRARRTSRTDDDEAGPARRSLSLEDIALDILAKRSAETAQLAQRGEPVGEGVVAWTGLGTCTVEIGDEPFSCRPPAGGDVAVGDVALVRRIGDVCFVSEIRPRRTVLSRPDPANAHDRLVVVSNVDAIVVVVSVVAPPLHPRIVDRYLVAIQAGGAKPILAVNKTDLLGTLADPSEELDKLIPYAGAGIPIVECSAHRGNGVAQLRNLLAGKICAFVGHSGVGKSSIMNAICPTLGLDTGAVSEGYGRGTHTTTASSLHRLADGTCLIDTPGVRSFGLWEIEPDELAWYFPEFRDRATDCKYRDCRHLHEPHCAVKQAVEAGVIHSARYDAYLRLLGGGED